jgi:histidinol-phosphate/aromatic aminotransferase/cobyric acid decarboxylase-like protein/GTP:adenosylcobinamide-phosphate guanylyltransferase
MRAIILSAGMGKRLLPLTKNMPKSMVKLIDKPIMEYALDALVRKKVSEIIIVVGYYKNVIMEYFGDNYKGVKIKYVHNDDYETTNNIYSLKLGLVHSQYIYDENLIICEGDIAFEAKILDAIDDNPCKNLVFVSKYKPYMSGSIVKIDEDTNAIKELVPQSKQEEGYDYKDKYKTVNVYYLTNDFLKKYFLPALDLFLSNNIMTGYYELILGVLLYMGSGEIYAKKVETSKWYEIDDEKDLEMAEYIFAKNKFEVIKKLYGGYWKYDFLDFCYLFNDYFPDKKFYSQLAISLPQLLSNYPSGHETLCKMLSRLYKDDSFCTENLIIGNGASELIRIINKEIVNKITIPIPTFNEYENKLMKEQINYFYLSEDKNFELFKEDFVKSVKESHSNVALIINPNNPTGRINKKEDIIWILEKLKDVFLIIDESFIDFSGDRQGYSVQDLVNNYSNLVVIRSMSKEFGVPGLRLGYIVTSNKIIKEKILDHLPIWNINSISEYFIENFIRYQDTYNKSIKFVIEDRKEFYNDLKNIKYLKIIPSYANFFLCKLLRGSAKDLTEKLFNEYKILIKDCSNKKSLEKNNYIRISIKTKRENDILINALENFEENF